MIKYIYAILFICTQAVAQKSTEKNIFSNIAPVLTATGNQIYCPATYMKIVTDFNIVDPDDTGIDAVYIQISSGYIASQDNLSLSGNHPNISTSWDSVAGKLTLSGTSGQPTYLDIINAVKDIVYFNSSANPFGVRTFSITIGQANYLPSTDHYYQYIPNLGITWSNAKALAEASTYYGLQGYLATILAADEAQLCGEQASGAGWIGGSDEETEGVWKWMTGPEMGTIFWNGNASGSTPNYAKWNTNEPNNVNNEDYAHINGTGVGFVGSWNDLSNTGEPSGDYQPKGYVVEYGGMPGDPVLNISASTTITIPTITSSTPDTNCGSGTIVLQATSDGGTIHWYDTISGGSVLGTGNSFSTNLNTTTIFYADPFEPGCANAIRTAVTATINEIPVVTVPVPQPICSGNQATISASTTAGTVYWYNVETGGSSIGSGNSFTTQPLTGDTIFYVDAINNGCSSGNRIPVTITVNQNPVLGQDLTINDCAVNTVTLDAGISGMTYNWSNGETSQIISVNTQNQYFVIVTDPNNCSSTRNYNVILHNAPEITNVTVLGNTATIVTVENGNYEFSINGSDFQLSNVFNNLVGGNYVATVRETNGCGEDQMDFWIIVCPSFFTPNGDGYNDFWEVNGIELYPEASAEIYDRYGRLITILNAMNPSWNGTFNNKLLPSDDYWYCFRASKNAKPVKGHFALKR